MKVTRHVVKVLGSLIPSLLFKPVSPLPSAMEMYAAMCDVCMSHTHFLFVKLMQEFRLNLSLYWRSALKIACQNHSSASYCPPKENPFRLRRKNIFMFIIFSFLYFPRYFWYKSPLSNWGHNRNVK